MEYKLIISGFGGQGVLFLGKVIAQAAVIEGYAASWLPSYGPEMRGGTANCCVVISNGEISSPAVKRADVLVALNRPSIQRFAEYTDRLIITDEKFVSLCDNGINVKGVNTSLCGGGEKFEGLANMLMLGIFVKQTDIISTESVYDALYMILGKKKTDTDIDAFEYGLSL